SLEMFFDMDQYDSPPPSPPKQTLDPSSLLGAKRPLEGSDATLDGSADDRRVRVKSAGGNGANGNAGAAVTTATAGAAGAGGAAGGAGAYLSTPTEDATAAAAAAAARSAAGLGGDHLTLDEELQDLETTFGSV
ncbi:hypothetical protein HK102_008015, partial [Quaeritorhiza haematococci]